MQGILDRVWMSGRTENCKKLFNARRRGLSSAQNVGQLCNSPKIGVPVNGSERAEAREFRPELLECWPFGGGLPNEPRLPGRGYSAISFSITTFTCAVTSVWCFTGTSNSPTDFSASCNWILR